MVYKRRRERGAVTVELVVMLPIVLLLLAAILSTGVGLAVIVSATNAAREGARLAAVGVDDCVAFEQTVEDRAIAVQVDSVTMTYEDGTPTAGESLTVTVTYRNELANRFLPFFRSPATTSGTSRAELIGSETTC